MGDTKTYSRVELRNGGRTKRVSEVRSFAVLAHLAILRSWQQRAGCLIKAGRLWSVGDHTLLARWSHEDEGALRLITGADDDHRLVPTNTTSALTLQKLPSIPLPIPLSPLNPPVYRFVVKYLALHTFSILSSPSPIYKKFSSSSSPFQKCINCHPSQTNRSWS